MTDEDRQLREFLHFLKNDGWLLSHSVQAILDRYAMAKERNWYPRDDSGASDSDWST